MTVIIFLALELAVSAYYYNSFIDLKKTEYRGTYKLGNKSNPKLKILVTGDSIASGVGASSFNKSFAGLIAQKYSSQYYVTLVDKGKSGARVTNFEIPGDDYDIAVVTIGSNDLFGFEPTEEFDKGAQKAFKKLSGQAKKVVVIGPADISYAEPIPFALRIVYKQDAVIYAAIMEKDTSPYGNIIYINPLTKGEITDIDTLFASDKFHPNDKGHEYWYLAVAPVLTD